MIRTFEKSENKLPSLQALIPKASDLLKTQFIPQPAESSLFNALGKNTRLGMTTYGKPLNGSSTAAAVSMGTSDASLSETQTSTLSDYQIDISFSRTANGVFISIASLPLGLTFSFDSIESTLKKVSATLTGPLTSAQYLQLQGYVKLAGSVLGTSSSIYSLLNGLVNGANGASIDWTNEDGTLTRIGSLTVGSTTTKFNELISAWFDGKNDPIGANRNVSKLPLFTSAGPKIKDISQYGIGDCYFLAALQAVVNMDPDFIKSMFVQNPNGSLSVRFFNNGKADWVTVDSYACENGALASHVNCSWVALIERAYVSFRSTYTGSSNTDDAISGGGANGMKNITGNSVSEYNASSYSKQSWRESIFSLIKTDLALGEAIEYGSNQNTYGENGKEDLVKGHMFAITGFDSSNNNFILTNPWGSEGSSGYNGTFEISIDQLWHGQSGSIIVNNSWDIHHSVKQLVQADSQTHVVRDVGATPFLLTAQTTQVTNTLLSTTQ